MNRLAIIGESINDSIPSTKMLFEASDIDGIKNLAVIQDRKGCAYIDVNIGRRQPQFMRDIVSHIQTITAKPLSIDTPDMEIAAAGLNAYDTTKASGQIPILNSVSPLRMDMMELYKIRPFMPVLMVSERVENGESRPNTTPKETYDTAKEMLAAVRRHGIQNSQCIIDPGIAPIGSDTEGHLKRILEAMRLIHNDKNFSGIHISVGLSNFTVMLPLKRKNGAPVKSALESAFITMAIPLGLDMIVGSAYRKYEILPDTHPAMLCLRNVLQAESFEAIMAVKEFYSQ